MAGPYNARQHGALKAVCWTAPSCNCMAAVLSAFARTVVLELELGRLAKLSNIYDAAIDPLPDLFTR